MSRVTSRGEAPVSLLCELFALSRTANYATKDAKPTRAAATVAALPRSPPRG
jgi:hypothetical protein